MKLQEAIDIDIYRTKKGQVLDIYALHRQLAKASNQRMLRLERAESPIKGDKLTFGAYEIAQDFLSNKKQGAKLRFNESKTLKGLSNSEIMHEIVVMQNFLNSKTSRVAGAKEVVQARIKTFEKMGIKFADTKEFYDFLNSESFRYLSGHGFNSEQIVDFYNRARDKGASPEELQKALNEYRNEGGRKSYKGLKEALVGKESRKKDRKQARKKRKKR